MIETGCKTLSERRNTYGAEVIPREAGFACCTSLVASLRLGLLFEKPCNSSV